MVKNVLISGATGFVGSNLVRRFSDEGYKVYALVASRLNEHVERINKVQSVEIVELDDVADQKIKTLPEFEACVHLAAYGVNFKQKDYNELIDANIRLTLRLIDYCANHKVKKFVNTGSSAEYARDDLGNFKEDSRLGPENLYGASKLSAIKMGNLLARQLKIQINSVRPFGIYGERESMHRLVPLLMEAGIKKQILNMSPGKQIRDYLYVSDMIDAFFRIATMESPNYEIYNICSSKPVTVRQIVKTLIKLTGFNEMYFNFGAFDYRPHDLLRVVGDNTKLREQLGWEPKVSLEEGLQRTYEWYREYFTSGNEN